VEAGKKVLQGKWQLIVMEIYLLLELQVLMIFQLPMLFKIYIAALRLTGSL